jgi:periplasmic divalent cation tolerance protein
LKAAQPKPGSIVVLITASSAAEAETIATTLLNRRQAACVNTVPGVTSLFWWHDKMEKADECLLVVKTREGLLPDLVKTVKKLHGSEVPEIIALPIVGGNADYLAWLEAETA